MKGALHMENRNTQKCYRDAEGRLCVRNISAYWLPELTLRRKIGGTIYTVTGSYEGTEPLDRKLRRIMEKNMEAAYD